MLKILRIALFGWLITSLITTGVILYVVGPSGLYIIGGLALFSVGMFFLFYKLFIKQMLMEERVKKTGVDGTAVIKEVQTTGIRINNNPQVKLKAEVKNSFGLIYMATMRALVSKTQQDMYKPGMKVPVKIDPKNENNVIIDTETMVKISLSSTVK